MYQTTNKVNNKIYIGVHKIKDFATDNYLGSGILLKKALKKYGRDNFERITLYATSCGEEAYFVEELIVDELFIERVDVYNIKVGGMGSAAGELHPMYGKHHTAETKQRMSESQKLCDNTRFSGHNHTEEAKEIIKEKMRQREFTKEHREKIRLGNTGKTMSEESKRKMSEAKKGIYKGENHPWWGRSHTEGTKEKLRKIATAKECSSVTKLKMSKNNRGKGNPNHRYVWITPAGSFYSTYEAAKSLGLDRKTIEQRCRKGARNAIVRYKDYPWRDLGWYLVNIEKRA